MYENKNNDLQRTRGECDEKFTITTWRDVVTSMTSHVMEKHALLANEMERQHKSDPKKWNEEMRPKWDATPLD